MTQTANAEDRRPFREYSAYVSGLRHLAESPQCAAHWEVQAVAALNGEASSELRRLTSLGMRRRFGAFFTGTDLSSRLVAHVGLIGAGSVFYDPTCGMGDLLLAAASKLPLQRDLSVTLYQWGRQLSGTDLHREFVDGTRARLVLFARQRHGSVEALGAPCARFFPDIRVADGLRQYAMCGRATHLLLNPPFGLAETPAGSEWGRGLMTESARFVLTALERAKPGAEMLAILPDVLRSGSFTARWRKRVSELAHVSLVEPYGVFDACADVDVFLLRLIRRECEVRHTAVHWPPVAPPQATTVADRFNVHVGHVVPHRDREAGPRHPYIHPRCVPAWGVMRSFPEIRQHEGRPFAPPFVVIRRTSRPGDVHRAIATVIAGVVPVAVENHLIVCEPVDRALATCLNLVRELKTKAVDDYLDARIRCRHLTVSAVEAIPIKPA